VILGIEYLHETFRRAVDAETEGRIPRLPDREGHLRFKCQPETSNRMLKRKRDSEEDVYGEDLPDVVPLDPKTRFADVPRYACQRPCPLVCVNQDIVSWPSISDNRSTRSSLSTTRENTRRTRRRIPMS